MTETPDLQEEPQAEEVEQEQAGPETVNCRHCGQPYELELEANPDWQCPVCERYQDSMTCPTCGSVVRISLMPDGSAPEPHAPTRRRRAKGEES